MMHFETNIISIILASMLLIYLLYVNNSKLKRDRYFRRLILVTIIILVIDIGAYICRMTSSCNIILLHASQMIFFISQLSIAIAYFSYLFINIFPNRTSKNRITYGVMMLPFVLFFIATLSSPWTNAVFSITEKGFVFGILWYILIILIFFYGLMFIAITIIYRENFPNSSFWLVLLICPLLIFVTTIFQLRHSEYLLINSSYVVALYIIYFSVQSRRITCDELTGVLNTTMGERKIYDLLSSEPTNSNHEIAIINIDIDNFENINDSLGYNIGNIILIETAKALKKTFARDTIIARYSGDNFIICSKIGLEDAEKLLEEARNILRENVKLSRKYSSIEVSFSSGIAMYPSDGIVYLELSKKSYDILQNKKQSALGKMSNK